MVTPSAKAPCVVPIRTHHHVQHRRLAEFRCLPVLQDEESSVYLSDRQPTLADLCEGESGRSLPVHDFVHRHGLFQKVVVFALAAI